MHITDDQIATFKNQGFLIIENFLSRQEQKAALDGFFKVFAPPYDRYIALGRQNDTPGQKEFPWNHSGLNHAAAHPDLIDVAQRILKTREIRLGEGHLGMKYAGEEYWTAFHIDYGNNTLGPIISPDDFMHLAGFYCFDDVTADTAPIQMVPNGKPDDEAVPMIVPGGSICLYSPFTRHTASPFLGKTGHRPVMWVGFNRKDRPWDGARSFTYKSGANYKNKNGIQGFEEGINRFITESSPRQLELLGFPPPGDPLWTKTFIDGMADRYAGFNTAPYFAAIE